MATLEQRIQIRKELIASEEKSLAMHKSDLAFLERQLWERDSMLKKGHKVQFKGQEYLGSYTVIGYNGVDLYALDNEHDPFKGIYHHLNNLEAVE